MVSLVLQTGVSNIVRAAILCAVLILATASSVLADSKGELVFGMSGAFTGTNGGLGIDFRRGAEAYLKHLNSHGGAGGWTIRILSKNDGYNPGPSFANTVEFIRQNKTFALFGYVGTPTTTRILPLLHKLNDEHLYLLFPITGGQSLRTPPLGSHVYNLRASYYEEASGLVKQFLSIGRTRIAVFYQNDAYGRTGWEGVRRALKDRGLSMVSEAAYVRGVHFEQSFSHEVSLIMAGKPDAIISIGTYGPQGAFIRDLRNAGHTDIPVAGLSFANGDKMLDLLRLEERATDRSYTQHLFSSQVVPYYGDTSLPAVREYRKVMRKAYGKEAKFGYISFEGYLNARMLGEVVRRMADQPRRDRIPATINSITNFDLGLGEEVDFHNRHQGMDTIYYTTVVGDHFEPVTDWSRWRK